MTLPKNIVDKLKSIKSQRNRNIFLYGFTFRCGFDYARTGKSKIKQALNISRWIKKHSIQDTAQDAYIDDPDGFFKTKRGKTVAFKLNKHGQMSLSGIEGEWLKEKKKSSTFIVNATHEGSVGEKKELPNIIGEKLPRNIAPPNPNKYNEKKGGLKPPKRNGNHDPHNKRKVLDHIKFDDEAHESAMPKDLTQEEVLALTMYSLDEETGLNRKMNNILRNRKGKMTGVCKKMYDGLISAFDRYEGTTENIRVYRGMPAYLLDTLIKDGVVTDLGFSSTSTSDSAASYYSDDNIVMAIDVPKGYKAMSLKQRAYHEEERERLINKCARFKLKGNPYKGTVIKNGVEVKCTFVRIELE